MQYNPSLDGLRGVCVLVVVAFHTIYPLFMGGFVGVDVFFVLSGFLITTILRTEIAASGSVDLKGFYLRRLARLMPALVMGSAGAYAIVAVFRPDLDVRADILAGLVYVSDYGKAFWNVPDRLAHTWSLSVEEHFYLLWPAFLIAAIQLSERALFTLLGMLFVAATVWRIADFLLWDDFARTYYRFDTRLSGLLLGSLLAVRRPRPGPRAAGWLGGCALATLAVLAIGLPWKSALALLAGITVAEAAAAALLVALASSQVTGVSRLLSHRWLVRIGVLSYSIYIWHYAIALVLRDSVQPFVAFAITLAASTAIAALSHRLVEAPLREWAGRRRRSLPCGPTFPACGPQALVRASQNGA